MLCFAHTAQGLGRWNFWIEVVSRMAIATEVGCGASWVGAWRGGAGEMIEHVDVRVLSVFSLSLFGVGVVVAIFRAPLWLKV